MATASTEQIEAQLQKLPPEKQALVYDFVAFLVQQETERKLENLSESRQTMLASEAVLARDWESPEEEAAWAHL
ncbi:MAG: hypothetical protein JO316_25700 [Abitibacteriaceae bacterium]|nr:hypothetical protein [Abditibacteriaceae bacterium]